MTEAEFDALREEYDRLELLTPPHDPFANCRAFLLRHPEFLAECKRREVGDAMNRMSSMM